MSGALENLIKLLKEETGTLVAFVIASVVLLVGGSFNWFDLSPVVWAKPTIWIVLVVSLSILSVRATVKLWSKWRTAGQRKEAIAALGYLGLEEREFVAKMAIENICVFSSYSHHPHIMTLEHAGIIVRGRGAADLKRLSYEFPDFVWKEFQSDSIQS